MRRNILRLYYPAPKTSFPLAINIEWYLNKNKFWLAFLFSNTGKSADKSLSQRRLNYCNNKLQQELDKLKLLLPTNLLDTALTIADRRADKTTDRVRIEQERKLTRLDPFTPSGVTIADRRADKTTDRVRTEQERKLTRLDPFTPCGVPPTRGKGKRRLKFRLDFNAIKTKDDQTLTMTGSGIFLSVSQTKPRLAHYPME